VEDKVRNVGDTRSFPIFLPSGYYIALSLAAFLFILLSAIKGGGETIYFLILAFYLILGIIGLIFTLIFSKRSDRKYPLYVIGFTGIGINIFLFIAGIVYCFKESLSFILVFLELETFTVYPMVNSFFLLHRQKDKGNRFQTEAFECKANHAAGYKWGSIILSIIGLVIFGFASWHLSMMAFRYVLDIDDGLFLGLVLFFAFGGILFIYLAASPFLVSGLLYERWAFKTSNIKETRIFSTAVLLLFTLELAVPSGATIYSKYRYDNSFTFTVEKWIRVTGSEKQNMVPDMEEKLDLEGKTIDFVKNNLGEPDRYYRLENLTWVYDLKKVNRFMDSAIFYSYEIAFDNNQNVITHGIKGTAD